MDLFIVKYLFINSLFYIISILFHKITSSNWRVDPQPTMKFLKIKKQIPQLMLILLFGFFIFITDLIIKNKLKL
jgi:hypothetical protein